MAVTVKSPATLALPLRTRIALSFFSSIIDASRHFTINRSLLKLFDSRSPPDSKPVKGVKTHDVVVDPARNLWFRVFVPTQHTDGDLPVVAFFHGGGFVFLSPDDKGYDAVCRRFARKLPAVVVSVDYRLAPEHRYPAQHDDCFDVLKFLDDEQNKSKISLPENANLSRCFLAGDSAGGNLVHHVAQRACEFNFKTLKVIGAVPIQPFFGGKETVDSEVRLDGTPIVSRKRTDWLWKMFMPEDEELDWDHPIINVSGPKAVDISKMDFPATMVVVGGFDALSDWQKRYYEWLQKSGKEVYLVEYPNMCHAFYVFPELPESGMLIAEIKEFIDKVSKRVSSSQTQE